MIRVITYGTYDLLHYGHIRLLQRAKALGDYLIVGVTADDFDKTRGKINVKQTLMERIENVRSTGLADEIIVEEYEGQKIDDIRRYGIDIFTVGSDWQGKFDYLSQYCKVIYLERTEGVSSSEIRSEKRKIRLGLVGNPQNFIKFIRESKYVNGVDIVGINYIRKDFITDGLGDICVHSGSYQSFLDTVDAVCIFSHPSNHAYQVRTALLHGVHVFCESPMTYSSCQTKELFQIARQNHCILMEGIKTAYSTAYSRLLLLVKSGKIGEVVSVDATCTSLQDTVKVQHDERWNSISAWGPIGLLPVFQLLGTNYVQKLIISKISDTTPNFDLFTKINFIYPHATATVKVGKGVKSEGELVVSGTQGYVYVPAPWWKTDYFEIRYEDTTNNKRYFYQLDGEGIRYEIVAFLRSIEMGRNGSYISEEVSVGIGGIFEDFINKRDFIKI